VVHPLCRGIPILRGMAGFCGASSNRSQECLRLWSRNLRSFSILFGAFLELSASPLVRAHGAGAAADRCKRFPSLITNICCRFWSTKLSVLTHGPNSFQIFRTRALAAAPLTVQVSSASHDRRACARCWMTPPPDLGFRQPRGSPGEVHGVRPPALSLPHDPQGS
jgi:hypothetical protein